MALSTTISYDTAGNFTYDSATTEFSGSVVRLKDVRPAGYSFVATFQDGQDDGDYGAGTLTATVSSGTPTVTSEKLVFAGADEIYWPGEDNFPTDNTGTIRFKVRPDYSGSPAVNQEYIHYRATSGENNQFWVTHTISGTLDIDVWSSVGSYQSLVSAAWSPVSGTEYEIEVNFDFTSGSSKVFIDGVQHGSTSSHTMTRSQVSTDRLYIGDASNSQAFAIGWIALFDTVQHTAAYTPEGEPSATQYYTSTATPPVVEVNSAIRASEPLTFSASVDETGSDQVSWVIEMNNTDYYWNGSAWTTSDLSLTQSNTTAEVNTNISSLDLPTDGADIVVKALLYSADGTSTPTATSCTVGYNFANPEPSAPAECMIYGDIRDILGSLDTSSAYLQAELLHTMFYGENIIRPSVKTAEVDSTGSFSMSLIETTSGASSPFGKPLKYKFSIVYTDSNGMRGVQELGLASVPNQATEALTDLTFS